MDAYSIACLAAVALAVSLRRLLVARVLAVAFLFWVGVHQQADIQQAQRMVRMQIAASSEEGEAARPPQSLASLRDVLERTSAGLIAFLSMSFIALVPAAPRREAPADPDRE